MATRRSRPPPASRRSGRNAHWRNFQAFDIMSMPDKWEYPWFAAWDLAFHCVTLAHVDPAFAKYQLLLVCREWFQSPNGALPAYEWDFGDVNPPVQAWAALEVFAIDGGQRLSTFLSRIFDKLLVNFTWWVNRLDASARISSKAVFSGSTISVRSTARICRLAARSSNPTPPAGWRSTRWSWASLPPPLLGPGKRPDVDLVLKFLEHFAGISAAMETQGLWDETDGLNYDRLVTPDGRQISGESPVDGRHHSSPGGHRGRRADAAPLAVDGQAVLGFPAAIGPAGPGAALHARGLLRGEAPNRELLLSVLASSASDACSAKSFDESEFLSPYGLRAISAYHRDHPYMLEVEGMRATIDYEPAESTTDMFGGNSNWRGPIWFPLNYLLVSVLERYRRFFGEEFTIEYPTGSGRQQTLEAIINDLWDRLISIFLVGPDGRRPCFGWVERMQQDPNWKNNLLFNEYFHGDNGAGLGASHQTGWTGLVADMIRRRHGAVQPLGYSLRAATRAQSLTASLSRPGAREVDSQIAESGLAHPSDP